MVFSITTWYFERKLWLGILFLTSAVHSWDGPFFRRKWDPTLMLTSQSKPVIPTKLRWSFLGMNSWYRYRWFQKMFNWSYLLCSWHAFSKWRAKPILANTCSSPVQIPGHPVTDIIHTDNQLIYMTELRGERCVSYVTSYNAGTWHHIWSRKQRSTFIFQDLKLLMETQRLFHEGTILKSIIISWSTASAVKALLKQTSSFTKIGVFSNHVDLQVSDYLNKGMFLRSETWHEHITDRKTMSNCLNAQFPHIKTKEEMFQ